MSEVTIIGIDLAKRTFQFHGAGSNGSVLFRKKFSRGQVLAFVAGQPRCVVAMEACATAHGWGREFEKLGHEVRLIPPVYVKPFLKRQKNDVADAEARPTGFLPFSSLKMRRRLQASVGRRDCSRRSLSAGERRPGQRLRNKMKKQIALLRRLDRRGGSYILPVALWAPCQYLCKLLLGRSVGGWLCVLPLARIF